MKNTLKKIGNGKILVGAAHASFLREDGGVSFISRFDRTDPRSPAQDHHGYQRPPTTVRFGRIAKYYKDNGHSNWITPIIVSVRLTDPTDLRDFIELFEAGDVDAIHDRWGMDVFSIMDGQHRIKGLEAAIDDDASFDPMVPVACYVGLTFEEEAIMFSDINGKQKKLPKALIEITRADVTERFSTDYEQQIRVIAAALCREEDSVWGPRDGEMQVNLTGVRDPNRPVTYEGIRRSTKQMFPKELFGRLYGLGADVPKQISKDYWAAVSEACEDAWNGEPSETLTIDEQTGEETTKKVQYRIRELVGVAALAKLGHDIIQAQINSSDSDRMKTLVAKLDIVDWEKDDTNPWMKSQAGFAGQRVLYEVLYNVVFNDEEVPLTHDDRLALQTA